MSAEEQRVQNHYMLLYGIVKSIVKWNFIMQGLKLQPFFGIFLTQTNIVQFIMCCKKSSNYALNFVLKV